ncbi:MAG: acyl-ACP--UDP-N-acetylglucosamine O-acyltransferase [Inquilinus sp.]|nr:acyl-ACP--UDP-N-acetylglucosamine O-acyltransferase [Inquilinus sp.]
MPSTIHPSAAVDPAARLGDNIHIGPFCVVGAGVDLADGVRLESHVVVEGRTTVGAGTRIFPFASIGHIPQDLKYHGEESRLEIGGGCTIREYVTISPGTEGGGMLTRVGDNCLIMIGAHIAHDCMIGNNVILVNNATLAGHVEIGDHAILGGLSAVHQFVRIGEHAFVGGLAGVERDVIPYGMVVGERGFLNGLNLVGLKRRGFGRDDIHTLRGAYRALFGGDGQMSERIEAVAASHGEGGAVGQMIEFLRNAGSRKILRPRGVDDA